MFFEEKSKVLIKKLYPSIEKKIKFNLLMMLLCLSVVKVEA